ncbi:hypothetical protein DTO021D3_6674 [Paecilomyces variotii]|nr:hypothetical protein DTO169E5_8907 [Paecilomyces variotii]KAJ9276468.1 hypothetical protein DTO021D3_6674 [Paecilomyces variotii]KAJ9355945.1 hypothetical protein DTO027B9_3787 [Paecilomyces variotii]
MCHQHLEMSVPEAILMFILDTMHYEHFSSTTSSGHLINWRPGNCFISSLPEQRIPWIGWRYSALERAARVLSDKICGG